VLQAAAPARPFVSDFFDFSIYVDADEPLVRSWFLQRFERLRATAFQDPASYFHRYAEMAAPAATAFAEKVWETINGTYLYAKEQSAQALNKRNRYGFLKEIIAQCQTLTGTLSGTMNHDAGYVFLRIGRYLERADMTSRIVDIRSANLLPDVTQAAATYENLQWMSVLSSLTGYQMYRREMQLRVQRTEVLRFLFQSTVFPRSLSFCINAVQSAMGFLPHHDKAQLVAHRVKRQLDNAQIDRLKQAELQMFIDQLQIGFAQAHDELQLTYFSGLGAAAA